MINFAGQFLDSAQDIGLYRLLWASAFALGVIWLSGKNLAPKIDLST